MILNIGGRTDIVNYYTEWFMNRINEGYVYSRNPLFKNQISKYDLSPSEIDCLMMCSKNYKPILKYLDELNSKYKLICHYTITAYGEDVEPYVPSINQSINTLVELSNIVGREKVIWRFDPLLLTDNYSVDYLITTFDKMAKKIFPYVQRCIFSFVEMYKKLAVNMPEIIPFTEEDKVKLVRELGIIGEKYDLYLQTCGTDLKYEQYGVHQSGCTTTNILEQANNDKYKKVKEGHARKGCHCIPSRDIGAYDTCLNRCKYCYANKRPQLAVNNHKKHNPHSPLLIGELKETDNIRNANQKSFIIKK